MPYIPQVKVSNIVYDLKDTEARNQIDDLKSALSIIENINKVFVQTANATASDYYKTFTELSTQKLYLIELTVAVDGTYTLRAGTSNSSAAMVDTIGTATVTANEPVYFLYKPTGAYTTSRLSTNTSHTINIYEIVQINGYPTLNYGSITSGMDLNDIETNSKYVGSITNAVNAPDAMVSDSAMMVITTIGANKNTRLQFAIGFLTGDIYYRGMSGGSWRNWRGIQNGITRALISGADLNDIDTNSKYVGSLADALNTPSDLSDTAGWVITWISSNINTRSQFVIGFGSGKIYYRRMSAGTWGTWKTIGGNVTNITNEYVTQHYENTFNATVSPQITTDTNNYLAPSGTNADRKADIEALLATGICRLGPGNYYVSGIDMPNDTMLVGSGRKTNIILLGNQSDTGYAIHLGDRCTVKDITILGSTTTLDCSTYNFVSRHGILFEATYDTDESTRKRGIVEGCDIANFPGGGITCYNTGYTVKSCIMVTNCYIHECMDGINVQYFSEFNIFSGNQVFSCYHGCVNNGGNNLFTACNFTGNIVGMICDNSQGQLRNDTHGSVIGCIFDHADNNNGIGIKMDGCHNGQVFSDCQLFFADIEVNNCSGVQFNNFNTGSQVDIRVTKGQSGGLIMFNNFVFTDNAYTISVDSGYDLCKFVNCWTKNGIAVTVD